jgi:membrane protein required for colicin V production
MILDIVFAVLVASAFALGYKRGLVRALLGTLAILVALVAAIQGSRVATLWLHEQTGWDGPWMPLAGLILVFVAVLLIFQLIGSLLEGVLKAVALGWLNRSAGGLLFGGAMALICATALWYLYHGGWLPPEAIDGSMTLEPLLDTAPLVTEWVGALIPAVQDAYAELERLFGEWAAQAETEVAA